MLKLAVLVSGGGTNLQAIMDGIASGSITNAKIVTVISNNKNAYALTRAEQAGIPASCISPKDYADREAFHEALLKALVESEADLIVLAGCLVVIPEMIGPVSVPLSTKCTVAPVSFTPRESAPSWTFSP